MGDTETETVEPEPAQTEPEAARSTPERLPDDHPLVKAYQATKDDLAKAKGRVKEFEDLNKSEQEKLTEKSAELEKNLTAAQSNAARYEIALEKGLTKSQAKRLVGSTREELEADADELLADLGVSDEPGDKPGTSRRPKERLRPGASPDKDPDPDPDALAEKILSRGF